MSLDEAIECIVCERPLRGDVFMRIKIEDQYVRLCCPLCFKTFDKRRSFYLSRREANESLNEIKENQKKKADES